MPVAVCDLFNHGAHALKIRARNGGVNTQKVASVITYGGIVHVAQ